MARPAPQAKSFVVQSNLSHLMCVFRALLGEGLDARDRSNVLQCLSAGVVTEAVAARHGVILRDDLRRQPRQTSRLRLLVLVEDGAGDMLQALPALPGVDVEVTDHVRDTQILPGQDFHALASQLASLSDTDRLESAGLVRGRSSSTPYPYSQEGPAPREE